MTAYQTTLPATKTVKEWSVTFHKAEGDYCPIAGVLEIATPKQATEYVVTEFPCGFPGRAFHLAKITSGTDPESEAYDCFVARSGSGHTCDCKGFVYGRNKPCKHLNAVIRCLAERWL